MDITKLASGQVLAQAAGLAAVPLIARIYSPEAVGGYASIMSLANMLIPVACLRYEQAIIQKSSDDDARALQVMCHHLALVFSVLVFCGVAAVGSSVGPGAQVFGSRATWILLPVLIYLSAVRTAMTATQISYGQFGYASLLRAVVSIGGQALKILLGLLFAASASSLVLSHILAALGGCGIAVVLLQRAGHFALPWSMPVARLIGAMRRYSLFLRYNVVSTLLAGLATHALVPLLAILYPISAVGGLVMVRSLMILPVSLVGSAVGEVVYQRCAPGAESVPVAAKAMATEVLRFVIPLAVFPFAFLGFNAGTLLPGLLGPEWGEVGPIAAVLSPHAYVLFVTSTISTLFLALNQQKAHMRMTFVLFAAQLIVVLAASNAPFVYCLGAYVAAASGTLIVGYGWLLARFGVEIRPLATSGVGAIAASALIFGGTHAAVTDFRIAAAIELAWGLLYSSAIFIRLRKRRLNQTIAGGGE